jgi:hypothetical protein
MLQVQWIEGLFGARWHQYFTLTTAAHGTDQACFFHFFNQTRSTVVANFQVALHQ